MNRLFYDIRRLFGFGPPTPREWCHMYQAGVFHPEREQQAAAARETRKSLTVERVHEARHEMEEKVLTAVREFSQETGVVVERLHVVSRETTGVHSIGKEFEAVEVQSRLANVFDR